MTRLFTQLFRNLSIFALALTVGHNLRNKWRYWKKHCSTMTLLKKVWKESASLIICGRNANNVLSNGANYRVNKLLKIHCLAYLTDRSLLQILVMKRSSNATFMPDMVVFPGGVIEAADSRPAWMTFLRRNATENADKSYDSLRTTQQKRPFLFDNKHPIHRNSSDDDTLGIDRYTYWENDPTSWMFIIRLTLIWIP